MRPQIHVGAFFLRFVNFHGRRGRGDDLGADLPGAEIALDDGDGGQSGQGPPVGLLPGGLVRIVGQSGNLGGKELGGGDVVFREGACGEGDRVEPAEGGVLQRAVVEVEDIHVENRLHARVPSPIKNARAALERTALRPAAEANRRDVTSKYAVMG